MITLITGGPTGAIRYLDKAESSELRRILPPELLDDEMRQRAARPGERGSEWRTIGPLS